MKVSMEGFEEKVVTFEAEDAVTAGELVLLTGNGRVGPCANAGDVPAGVALSVREGFAAVQTGGYMKLPCASDMTVGWHQLALNSDLAVAETAGGRCALVTDVSDGVCGAIL